MSLKPDPTTHIERKTHDDVTAVATPRTRTSKALLEYDEKELSDYAVRAGKTLEQARAELHADPAGFAAAVTAQKLQMKQTADEANAKVDVSPTP